VHRRLQRPRRGSVDHGDVDASSIAAVLLPGMRDWDMPDGDDLDLLSTGELRSRLHQVLVRLDACAPDDPARSRLVATRLDLASALRRVTGDERGQLAAWAARSTRAADVGRPFVRSDGEGGGASG
jgi:hypothetical protein